MKRIRFAKAELELILSMIAIAGACMQGEGDYQDWNDKSYRTLEQLRSKVWEKLENDLRNSEK